MSDFIAVAPRRLRMTRACDFCHRRGRKCRTAEDRPTECTTCITHGVKCSWERVAAKRGVKRRQQRTNSPSWTLDEQRHGSRAWLTALIDIYFADVYPMSVHRSYSG